MPDFSVITSDPTIRALVQQNMLERAFHDALFPRLLFRGEAEPVYWPANVGDNQTFTGTGLIPVDLQPQAPGTDPTPVTYTAEQWTCQMQQYNGTIDTTMPNSMVAIANLFLRNCQQLGLMAAQTMNRLTRDKMYNAATAGSTQANGATSSSTSLPVFRLNGFTTARRPDLTNGSPVQFATVSGNNPLAITVNGVANTVVGFVADNPGDEIGPGTLTLGSAISATDKWAVLADNRTFITRVGGGTDIDAISSTDVLTLAAIRNAVARFQQENVPEDADGRFHCHLDPTSQTEVFADVEWRQLLTSLPDYYMYRQFTIGELLGCVFARNSECPIPETVRGSGTDGNTYSLKDPFGALITNTSSDEIHRPLFIGQGAIMEYYADQSVLLTEAGVTGRIGEPKITNNSIEVFTDRIQLILRAPLNRTQDLVSATWRWMGDFPLRTDVTTGDAAKYKRLQVIEHA